MSDPRDITNQLRELRCNLHDRVWDRAIAMRRAAIAAAKGETP